MPTDHSFGGILQDKSELIKKTSLALRKPEHSIETYVVRLTVYSWLVLDSYAYVTGNVQTVEIQVLTQWVTVKLMHKLLQYGRNILTKMWLGDLDH